VLFPARLALAAGPRSQALELGRDGSVGLQVIRSTFAVTPQPSNLGVEAQDERVAAPA
jgi:hypothetical protein